MRVPPPRIQQPDIFPCACAAATDAVPKVHEKADEFNRVQRGHQNMLETMSSVCVMGLVAGLKYPLVAAGLSVAYCIGNWFYQTAYMDVSQDVSNARYKHPRE